MQRGLAPALPALADGGYSDWASTTEEDGVVLTMVLVRDQHGVLSPVQ